MKKGITTALLLLIGFIATTGYLFWSSYNAAAQTSAASNEQVKLPLQATVKPPTVSWGDQSFAYAALKVNSPDKLSLVPNFTDQKTASTLMEDYGCTAAINGSFYDTSNQPLGYFESGGAKIRNVIVSRLINGFIWADDSGVFVTDTAPSGYVRFGMQTGPLLYSNSKALALSISNDEHARRVLAAQTTEGSVFIAIYNPDNVYEGPLLADAPQILSAIARQEKLNVLSAINLDGGSASAFIYDTVALSELTPVGSIFCLKQ